MLLSLLVSLLCICSLLEPGLSRQWRRLKTSPTEDEVDELPGLDFDLPFKQYSGYLRGTGQRRLHYWFIESAKNPAEDPVVLWLNGGPGCSSLMGLLNEHGPFTICDDGITLKLNPYSWNKVANMLYLESPAGVGFSYTKEKDYKTSDTQTAMDNYSALRDFFRKFPYLAGNELYLTGQSYAGVYIPTLAVRIMGNPSFNLKGIAIGNGVLDFDHFSSANLYYAYYHGFIGSDSWNGLLDSCCSGNDLRCNFQRGTYMRECRERLRLGHKHLRNISVYNIYKECAGGVASPHNTPDDDDNDEENPWEDGDMLSTSGPCTNSTGITTYLNHREVRRALHIPEELPGWLSCSRPTRRIYRIQYNDVQEEILKILQKYRVLLYSGDWDMVCSFLGTQWFVKDLNLEVSHPRTIWQYTDTDGRQQLAGFVKVFQNLTVATIQGAGHSAPKDKPLQALKMFTHFLKGEYFGTPIV